MKLSRVVIAAALVGVSASVEPCAQSGHDAGSANWEQLFEHDVTVQTAVRGPLDGAAGAGVIGFRVSARSQGTAIITGLDRPALGVFVGLQHQAEDPGEPYRTMRLEFILHDRSSRAVMPNGGSGIGMLFHSPDGLPMSEIAKVALFVDRTAEWTR